MSTTVDLPRVRLAGRDPQPGHRRVERRGRHRADRRALDRAGRGVHARWARRSATTGRAGVVDRLDRARRRPRAASPRKPVPRIASTTTAAPSSACGAKRATRLAGQPRRVGRRVALQRLRARSSTARDRRGRRRAAAARPRTRRRRCCRRRRRRPPGPAARRRRPRAPAPRAARSISSSARDPALLDRPRVARAQLLDVEQPGLAVSSPDHRHGSCRSPRVRQRHVDDDVARRPARRAGRSAAARRPPAPTTSMSCHDHASSASALATASLAQNRAARCCAGPRLAPPRTRARPR